jgi:vitamin B12/bleomycin/antimicrobial peptide transport system ATP-binding/permease protein
MNVLNGIGRRAEQKRLLVRFWRSASTFWTGRWAKLAWSLTVCLLLLAIAQLLVQYRLNLWNRNFFDALERRDGSALWSQAELFLPLAFASIALASTSVWGRMTTQRKWRESTTRQLLAYWLSKEHFRRLHHLVNGSDNPEYRLTEDLRIATDEPIDLGLAFFTSILTAITFLSVLWSVGGSIGFDALGRSWVIPGYLVIGVIVYSAIFSGLMLLVGRQLTTVVEDKNQSEAEFRSAADRLRRDGDRGIRANESAERRVLWLAVRKALTSWRALLWQLVRITIVSHGNFVMAPIVGLLLCVPKYVTGSMSLGEVTQAAAAFVIVQHACNWIVDNYGRVAAWRSSVNRVSKLLIALDTLDAIDRTSEVKTLVWLSARHGHPSLQPSARQSATARLELPGLIHIGRSKYQRAPRAKGRSLIATRYAVGDGAPN